MRVCLEYHISEDKACLSLLFLVSFWKVPTFKHRSVFDLALLTQIHKSTMLISFVCWLLFCVLFLTFQANEAKTRRRDLDDSFEYVYMN